MPLELSSKTGAAESWSNFLLTPLVLIDSGRSIFGRVWKNSLRRSMQKKKAEQARTNSGLYSWATHVHRLSAGDSVEDHWCIAFAKTWLSNRNEAYNIVLFLCTKTTRHCNEKLTHLLEQPCIKDISKRSHLIQIMAWAVPNRMVAIVSRTSSSPVVFWGSTYKPNILIHTIVDHKTGPTRWWARQEVD